MSKLEQVKSRLLEIYREEVSYLLERISIEHEGISEVISFDTPVEELPLYVNGGHGKVNEALAKCLLSGKDPLVSESLVEFVEELIDGTEFDSYEFKDVLSYVTGKIQTVSELFKVLDMITFEEIANRWAALTYSG